MRKIEAISREQIERILEVSRLLAVTADLDLLLRRITEAAGDILSCERASIFLHDVKRNQLSTRVALMSEEIRVPANKGIVGLAFTTNQVVDVPSAYDDPGFNREIDKRTGFLTRNLLAAPMADIDGKPLGVLEALNKNAGVFTPDDAALIQVLADQAGVAIQRYRLQSAALELAGLRHEMELARKIQYGLIPQTSPEIPGLLAVGRMIPASFTGGDCYDLWKTRDGRMGIFVADACGHGLAPTLVVLQARALVRTLSESELDPGKLLSRVNSRLAVDLESSNFVTAFLGFLSSEGSLIWSSAGHGPVMIRESAGQALRTLYPEMPPLAVLRDQSPFPAMETTIGKGGILAVLSDGITEAFNPAGELFGVNRLSQSLDETANDQPKKIIDHLFGQVHQWQQHANPADDQTVVLAMRRGEFLSIGRD